MSDSLYPCSYCNKETQDMCAHCLGRGEIDIVHILRWRETKNPLFLELAYPGIEAPYALAASEIVNCEAVFLSKVERFAIYRAMPDLEQMHLVVKRDDGQWAIRCCTRIVIDRKDILLYEHDIISSMYFCGLCRTSWQKEKKEKK